MGLPSVFIKIPINFLQKLICFFKIVLITALNLLGLLKQSQEEASDSESEDETTSYVYLIDRRCPIPLPVSVEILTAIIKKKLTLKKFGTKFGQDGEDEDEDEDCRCSICLDFFNNTDEIREMCNCNHVFHKNCIDTWVDLGRITCPLCRSMLFPDDLLVAERRTLLAAANSIMEVD